MKQREGAIFDLDGVIVDTARYHYQAWKNLANRLGFVFTEQHNERLKGVSRMRSLEILLEVGGITADEETKIQWAAEKNAEYVRLLDNLTQKDLLPGAKELLQRLRAQGIRIALGSASKNAPLILEKLEIVSLFDAIVDGTVVSRAKPAPDVFLKAAEMLQLPPERCVVFEDAQAGIEAARAAGCGVIAVGDPQNLIGADHYVGCLANVSADII